MKSLAVFAAALCLVAAVDTPVVAQTVGTPTAPIRTEGGLLAGKVLQSGVKAWLGVPFAKPPVNDLRWQPPQKFSWQGTWNADRIMPECIQVLRPHGINQYFGEEPTSENCLYMNIWAPANARASSRLPVVVFTYGGGYTIGSSGLAIYGGEEVAKRGAIFVNFNYRVGILGFMAHPELTREQGGHSGNYAFLDQNAALKWVHDNIEKFGGDPSKVLLMGQSAGAMSVTAQVFSPLSKGLFRAAFMSSGCIWGTPPASLARGEATGLEVQRLLKAGNLEQMRLVPADRILSLQAESQITLDNPGIRVGGVVDGYFSTKSHLDALKAHEDNDVPIVALSTDDDVSVFVAPNGDMSAGQNPLLDARSVAEYNETAYRMFGSKAPEFLKLYPASSDSRVREAARAAGTDFALQASARKCAQLKSQYDKTPTYISFFSRKHSYAPGVKIADQDTATIGAYHTSDIPFWFGSLDSFNLLRTTRAWTAADRQLSQDMTDVLIAFAATGVPQTQKISWPAWAPGIEQRVVIGNTVEVAPLYVAGMEWLLANPPARIQPAVPEVLRPRD